MLEAIDYFTKWIEADALSGIWEEKVVNFIWKTIVCHFKWPKEIITDKGKQFARSKVKDFMMKYGVKIYHSLPYYPRVKR